MTTVVCLNCGKDFEGRLDARFCSDKCRKAYSRNKSDIIPDRIISDITKSDKLFVEDAKSRGLGDYYVFGKPRTENYIEEKECDTCKTKFKTRLWLNRYCSPSCRDGALHV